MSDDGSSSASPPSGGQRLRFEHFEIESFPDGFLEARIEVEWKGERHPGTARGPATLQGGLRAGAEAMLGAIGRVTGDRLRLSLRGVKAIRAFDSWVVIASVRGQSDEQRYSLLGSSTCPDENTPRGAAVAILDAVNRLMERSLEGED